MLCRLCAQRNTPNPHLWLPGPSMALLQDCACSSLEGGRDGSRQLVLAAAGGSGKAIHGDAWMLDTEDEAAINPSLSDQSLLSQLAAIQVTCSECAWASGAMLSQGAATKAPLTLSMTLTCALILGSIGGSFVALLEIAVPAGCRSGYFFK